MNDSNMTKKYDMKDIIDYHIKIKYKDSDAMYELGKYYQYKKIYGLMKKYYLMGIEYENSSCAYELGRYYYRKTAYHKAKMYLKKSVKMGNQDAMDLLGDYYNYISDKGNYRQFAIQYYSNSVNKGNVNSISKLSLLFFKIGEIKTGLKLLRKGIEKGDVSSTFLMGKYCYSKKDIKGFIKNLEYCIKNNHQQALLMLCDYLYETKNIGKIPEYVEIYCEKNTFNINRLYLPPLILYYIDQKVKSPNKIFHPENTNTIDINILKSKLNNKSKLCCCDICKRKEICVPYGLKKNVCLDCYVFEVTTRNGNRALKKSLGALSRAIKDNTNKKRISVRQEPINKD